MLTTYYPIYSEYKALFGTTLFFSDTIIALKQKEK